MANQFRRFRDRIKNVDNTGFSSISGAEGNRLINKDGSANLIKTGMPFWMRISLFHSLIRMKWPKFLLIVFLFYTSINCLFALMYVMLGVENLKGVSLQADSLLNGFEQAFFFSSQTLTTVGYGHISPLGFATNVVAALESFVGILSFAMMTGLLYGRFSLPRAYIKFSENILVAPHKGYRALMIRMASFKNNHITDVEARMTMAIHFQEDGKEVTRFYTPNLEISKITSLVLSWTLVHLIDEESPLYDMGYEELNAADIEIIFNIKGFDENFSNIVQQRTSYTAKELVYGAKFTPTFHRSEDGSTTVLELDKLNDYQPATVPEPEHSLIKS